MDETSLAPLPAPRDFFSVVNSTVRDIFGESRECLFIKLLRNRIDRNSESSPNYNFCFLIFRLLRMCKYFYRSD